jgi:hypothetical protein
MKSEVKQSKRPMTADDWMAEAIYNDTSPEDDASLGYTARWLARRCEILDTELVAAERREKVLRDAMESILINTDDYAALDTTEKALGATVSNHSPDNKRTQPN